MGFPYNKIDLNLDFGFVCLKNIKTKWYNELYIGDPGGALFNTSSRVKSKLGCLSTYYLRVSSMSSGFSGISSSSTA